MKVYSPTTSLTVGQILRDHPEEQKVSVVVMYNGLRIPVKIKREPLKAAIGDGALFVPADPRIDILEILKINDILESGPKAARPSTLRRRRAILDGVIAASLIVSLYLVFRHFL